MWPLRSGFEMRAKLILVTLVGLLLCSLATLEITELARLADDTSNDFSLPHSGLESSSAVVRESRDLQPRVVAITHRCERPRVVRHTAGSSKPAKDFLHFLCTIRT
jgi:hypothetical protein